MYTKKRKILAVTGARSEYDIISPVLEHLEKNSDIELGIVVTGSHLSEAFGNTVTEIEKDGYKIISKIYNLINSNKKIGRILSLGNQIAPLAQIFEQWQPDIIIVAGDREEAISVSMTAAYMDIPVAHLAGGDIAKDGNIDNSVRYATSKFAHIHFTILKQHKDNLIRLGEDEWRIYNLGNPALDKFINTKKLSIQELENRTGFNLKNGEFGILIYHPIITQIDKEGENIKTIIKALKKSGLTFLINSPNSDAGYANILNYYEENVIGDKQFSLFKNLDREIYVNLLRHSKILVGNSSSGLIEAPSLSLPVVNIGPRQKSRFNAGNVTFVDYDENQIIESIQLAISPLYKEKLKDIENPYGNGESALNIAKVLFTLNIDKELIHKNITY